jgi:acyl CoA:acetate/3-ketoacid CoA transferase beta subunit
MSEYRRDEVCAIAIADAFRDDGEIFISPMGLLPSIGARLAKASFAPDLLLSDGQASLIANIMPVGVDPADAPKAVVESWVPFRGIFDIVWHGKRHVMMGATQIDCFGNQNISCIGDWAKPKVQLLGVRGAPGNTISHTTSYWVPNHSRRVFVEKVDVVCGLGYDRIKTLHPASQRGHEIRCVITNLAVLDFQTPENTMRVASLHPGVSIEQVIASTGFDLVIPEELPQTREPTKNEIQILRTLIDPKQLGMKEVVA